MTNTTKEEFLNIPETIIEWIAKYLGRPYSYVEKKLYTEYSETFAVEGIIGLYHHLTTSSPSNSGGISDAEEFWQMKKYVMTGIHGGEYIDKDDFLAYASQFPQPQLVSGVRTKEEILKEEMKKNKDKAQPAFVWNEDYAGANEKFVREDIVKEAMEEYATQFHSTRPIQNNKLLVVSFEEFPNVEWVASLGNLPGMCESGKTKMEAFAELTISLMMKLAYDSNIHDKNDLVEMAGHIKAKLLNKEPNAQERDASKADQGTVSGEHHPTQEIEGEGREAIEFAEWVNENYMRFKDGSWEHMNDTTGEKLTTSQLYNIYLEGKGREDLLAGGSNSDSASVVTPHSSAGNSNQQ